MMFIEAASDNIKTELKRKVKIYLSSHGYCVKPGFLVIGAQKGGTTSLFSYLAQHPSLVPSRTTKEVAFFSEEGNYAKGYAWYHAQFPYPFKVKKNTFAFEATPEYLYYPYCPERIHRYNSGLKLIIILRDPVSRAYSAWNMYRGFQNDNVLRHLAEYRDFAQAVREEIDLIGKGSAAAPLEPSYVRRGLYAEQVERYFRFFPREQVYITENKLLKNEPGAVLDEITGFLGVSRKQWEHVKLPVLNAWEYESPIPPDMRELLSAFYRPYNQKLFALIGKTYNWSS